MTMMNKRSDEFYFADNYPGLSASAGSYRTKSDCASKKRVQRDAQGDGPPGHEGLELSNKKK